MPDWEIYYYRNQKGVEPVKEFINKHRVKDQVKLFDWISRLEALGPNAARPLVDYLGDDIYELRVKLSDAESRVLYFYMFQNCIILTNAWDKKGSAKSRTEYKKHIEKAKSCKLDYDERVKNKGDLL